MKPTYTDNRRAPRMRKGKFSKMVITKELYKKFLREFPEYEGMTWEEFSKSWLEIARKFREEAIHNPLGVKLGSYLGEIKLQYLPYKFKAYDMTILNSTGEKVPFLNLDLRGKVPKIKWERRWAVKFNKILQFYAFNENRDMNKLAFEYIKNNAHKIRVSRNTLGGISEWRKKLKK